MYYLFFQIWLWLMLAFFLGWFAHWFICCRGKEEVETTKIAGLSVSESSTQVEPPATAPNIETVTISDDWKPKGFMSRPETVDDLKRIKGVGAVLEQTLNELGIYQFDQIADWSNENTAWIENFLAFPGRIEREDWINQARTLGKGETTEFAKRVDKGDVDYS